MAKRRSRIKVTAMDARKRVEAATARLKSAHFKRITQALANNGAVGSAADIRKAMRRSFWYYYTQQLIDTGLLRKTGRDQYQLTTAGRAYARAR